MLDRRHGGIDIVGMRTPLLARLILLCFIWVGVYGGLYITLDSLGLWAHVPAALAHALNLFTAAVLLFALAAHLLLLSGKIPERP